MPGTPSSGPADSRECLWGLSTLWPSAHAVPGTGSARGPDRLRCRILPETTWSEWSKRSTKAYPNIELVMDSRCPRVPVPSAPPGPAAPGPPSPRRESGRLQDGLGEGAMLAGVGPGVTSRRIPRGRHGVEGRDEGPAPPQCPSPGPGVHGCRSGWPGSKPHRAAQNDRTSSRRLRRRGAGRRLRGAGGAVGSRRCGRLPGPRPACCAGQACGRSAPRGRSPAPRVLRRRAEAGS